MEKVRLIIFREVSRRTLEELLRIFDALSTKEMCFTKRYNIFSLAKMLFSQ